MCVVKKLQNVVRHCMYKFLHHAPLREFILAAYELKNKQIHLQALMWNSFTETEP